VVKEVECDAPTSTVTGPFLNSMFAVIVSVVDFETVADSDLPTENSYFQSMAAFESGFSPPTGPYIGTVSYVILSSIVGNAKR